MVTLFPLRFSALPLFNHGEAMPESLNLKELEWKTLMFQIRFHPDPKIRQDAATHACRRIMEGYNGNEEYVPKHVFEPDW